MGGGRGRILKLQSEDPALSFALASAIHLIKDIDLDLS